jgi:hypothetical protein
VDLTGCFVPYLAEYMMIPLYKVQFSGKCLSIQYWFDFMLDYKVTCPPFLKSQTGGRNSSLHLVQYN